MTPEPNPISTSAIGRGWFAVLVLVAAMLIVPSSSAGDPLKYIVKDASTTGFHQDFAVTGNLTRTDAALVLQNWAADLDLAAQLVHNIKLRDFESGESQYQQYLLSGQNLEDLVVQLDMTETDVATFQHDNDENIRSLRELLNQTKQYDELQNAETTFRDQKDIANLKSIELQGEDLCTKIQSNYEGYADRADRIVNLSRKFGIDTSAFEKSTTDFAAILTEIDAVQKTRSSSIQEMIREIQFSGRGSGALGAASAVSVRILPDHGVYGDTLSIEGTVDAPVGTGVTTFVDGQQVGSVVTDRDGRFSFLYKIEQIDARTHTAYASTDSDISEVSSFTVASRNTTVSLEVHIIVENGTRKGVGTGRLVTEDGVPVRGARVLMDVDGRASSEEGVTGDDGEYTITAGPLSPRVHTLKAWVDPAGFPLNGSESLPVTVEVPYAFGLLASVVYLLGVGGAAIGGILFLRKRETIDGPPSAHTVEAEPGGVAGPPLTPTIEEAHLIANQIPVTSGGQIDGYTTIAQTYRRVVRELEARNPDLQLKSRTPRNLVALFADRPFGAQLAVLVGIHEKVWYAEHEPTDEDLDQMREAFIYIITEGSGH
ncbi:MAG TPA: DUF4129 domain-containing protein [Methanoregulaceae archaeon]|nr:DUF4129 domain-containing protein [Methanoregulaceae archaeon]